MRGWVWTLTVACTAPAPEQADLVTASGWVESVRPDPLASHREHDLACLPEGVRVEGGTLEVETGPCPYADLDHPLAAPVREGDRIEVLGWHGALAAEEPAEAHIALLLGRVILWERTLPIPSEADVWADEVIAPTSGEEGDPLRLHLHNHGPNSWNLRHVRRL